MRSVPYHELEANPPPHAVRQVAEKDEFPPNRVFRRRKARNRLLLESATGVFCALIFYSSLSKVLGPVFISHWYQIAGLLLMFMTGPFLIFKWIDWTLALRGIAEARPGGHNEQG